ncbi:hypothetical protein [Sneathiella chinensis]|uniref:Cytochrome-c oxidase n=1 Tax=Sneathiella chinensis TaxID=349750 RepID=A0ABQ5U8S0_9PROT|nr:hypothetical protein [Sneathiella chinensis]GLQ07593.1 hypothetical protein GCM10007924_28140 [Sneathiella chinensis]
MGRKLGLIYIRLAILWLLGGMIFGTWLGITENFQYSNPHAHANLVGFAVSALFGLILAVYPAVACPKLGMLQLVVYQVGAVLLVAGKVVVSDDPTNVGLVATGSIVTIIGTALFAVMLFTAGRRKTTEAEAAS